MTALILAVAILTGPPQPSGATIPLKVHLGKDWRSAVARSELNNNEYFFLSKRLRIEANYRLVVDEDGFSEPTYSVGRGDVRHDFGRGTFSGSGCFITALASIAAIDRWERENHEITYYEFYPYSTDEPRPEAFPVVVEGEK